MPIIAVIVFLLLGVVYLLLGLWSQALLLTLAGKQLHLLICSGLCFLIGIATPKSLNGLLLFGLLLAQIYVWVML